MVKPLYKANKKELHHFQDGLRILGPHPTMNPCGHHSLWGDCTLIQGDPSNLEGDCTGIGGDLDEIPMEERYRHFDISYWVEEANNNPNGDKDND